METQSDEGGGRVLLGDNAGGGAVMLWLLRFQCVRVWTSAGLPGTYIYSWLLSSDLNWTLQNLTTA